MHHRIVRRALRHRLAGAREIGPGRDAHAARGQRRVPVAQRQQRRDREATARGVTGDDDARGIDAGAHQPAIGRDGVVDGGGEGMLGAQPIIDGESSRAAHPGQPRHQPAMRLDRADRVPAAVQIEDDPVSPVTRRIDPLARHAAGIHRGRPRPLGQRRAAGHLLHPLAAGGDVEVLRNRGRGAEHVEQHRQLGTCHGVGV